MKKLYLLVLAVVFSLNTDAFGQAAQKGADLHARSKDRLGVEYVHYRPAKWETEQVVEIERDFPNQGGLLYLYVRNTSDREQGLRFWQYQGRDRSYWLQSNLISWDRTLKKHLRSGEMTVIEINGVSKDFSAGTEYGFTLVNDSWRPAMRHEGILKPDTVNVSFIRVLPGMDELEVHLRYDGNGPITFSSLGLEGIGVANVKWRGKTLNGPGHAIARVKLEKPVEPSTLLLLRAGLEEEGEQRTLYAHRRAFPDYFPVGTWGMDTDNYEYLSDSHIDTGIKGGRCDDEFFSGNAQKYGFRSLVHAGHWPENIERLKSLTGHPAVLAWLLGDEPDWSSHPQAVFALDKTIKTLDSTKPTFVTLCRNVKFMEFAPIVDLPCMDHYCVTAPTASDWKHEFGGRLEETGFYTRDLKYAAEPKPTVVWSQGIRRWSERPKRGTPTPEELSVQLLQNLGRGAKGILWFTWKSKIAEKYPDLLATAQGWNRVMQMMKEDLLGSEPVDGGVSAPEKVDVVALVGWDKVILCVSNLDYEIHDEAYPFTDKHDVGISLRLPQWIEPECAMNVTGNGITKVKLERSKANAQVTLDQLHDVAMIVLSNDAKTAGEYEKCITELISSHP